MTDVGNLAQFLKSVDSRGQLWLDDYDMDSFELLEGKERDTALELIVKQLVSGDLRAARALATIGESRFVEQLKSALSTSDGEMRVEIARALAKLGAGDGMLAVIIEVLRSSDLSDRASAAYALGEFRFQESYIALLETIRNDRETEVRTAAAISLMLLSGYMSNPLDPVCSDVLIRLDQRDPAEWQAVAEEFITKLSVDCDRCDCCGAICDRSQISCRICGTALKGKSKK
ncbi:MAG: HEAT repeat domain-containing protein [Candidatus Riflebacteria bacterium]|nr:HEAT repeat domain-containing protein [Candidatus Riflebacteria bacterium]